MADRETGIETGATHDFIGLGIDLAFKGLHASVVAIVGNIGRLDGCPSTSGELEGDMMLFWSKYSGI